MLKRACVPRRLAMFVHIGRKESKMSHKDREKRLPKTTKEEKEKKKVKVQSIGI